MKRTDFRPNNNSSSMTDKQRETIRNSYDLQPQNDSRQSFYGKATVTTENGRKTLRSYNTDVAYIENGRAVVTNTQSATTVRHVKEFLKQNGYKADTKAQIEKDYSTLHGYKGEEYNKQTGQYEEKSSEHHKPTNSEVDKFFEERFGHKPRNDSYIREWYSRFESPVKVWSHSDYDSRALLKKTYPEKFGNLDKDTNLNNKEFVNDKKYTEW